MCLKEQTQIFRMQKRKGLLPSKIMREDILRLSYQFPEEDKEYRHVELRKIKFWTEETT